MLYFVSCRYEQAAMELKSTLNAYVLPDTSPEDARDKEGSASPTEVSPSHSPKQTFLVDGLQKLSILSKQSSRQDFFAQLASDSSPDPILGNFMVEQVSHKRSLSFTKWFSQVYYKVPYNCHNHQECNTGFVCLKTPKSWNLNCIVQVFKKSCNGELSPIKHL